MYVFFYNRVFKKAPRIYCQKFARIELNIYHFKAVWPIDGFFFSEFYSLGHKNHSLQTKRILMEDHSVTIRTLAISLLLLFCISHLFLQFAFRALSAIDELFQQVLESLMSLLLFLSIKNSACIARALELMK